MASIFQRGPHRFRVLIRRKGTNLCKTFETRQAAEDWARVTEGKVTAGEIIERRTVTTLAQACVWMQGQIPDTPDAKNARAHFRYWEKSKFSHWAISAIRDWDLEVWVKEAGLKPQTTIHRLNALSKLVQTWGRAHKIAILSAQRN
jgi:hypothetical protein